MRRVLHVDGKMGHLHAKKTACTNCDYFQSAHARNLPVTLAICNFGVFMNKLLLGACAAALLSGTAHAQQNFRFQAKLDYASKGNGIMTGEFRGTLNGNLITNLSDISVFFDQYAFKGNGSLYNASYLGGGYFENGTGVVSLDGTENNFYFSDAEQNTEGKSLNFFVSAVGLHDFAFADNGRLLGAGLTEFKAFAVPEPAAWTMMIGGFGFAGTALRTRRRRINVRYA